MTDQTNPENEAPEPRTLEDRMVSHLRDWIRRAAVEVRDRGQDAELRYFLSDVGWHEDKTLVLRWQFEERVTGPKFDEESEGLVPRVKVKR